MTHPRKNIDARRRRKRRRTRKLKVWIAHELEVLMGEVLHTRDMLVVDGLRGIDLDSAWIDGEWIDDA